MSLIFPRLAQNFIKNGYFPTDGNSLSRILSALDVGAGSVRIFDPCCGEGVALAECKHHLSECGAEVQALAVEYDSERAWHAKGLLDAVLHSDINDVTYTPRSMSLLFLNPPYGDVVADKAQTGDQSKGDRLEKIFFRRTFGGLRFGGVLVLIVPYYVLDAEFSTLLARNFSNVSCHMAPEARFKQVVIMGVRKRSDRPDAAVTKMLESFGRGECLGSVLPEAWPGEPYCVPEADLNDAQFHFSAVRIDAPQLAAELQRLKSSTLWPTFHSHFGQVNQENRRPLSPMRDWHLALALAAGQICGVVRSVEGRSLLVKGDTYKSKTTTVDVSTNEDGSVTETRTATDIFVPVIRGIDVTPGPQLGAIVTIS